MKTFFCLFIVVYRCCDAFIFSCSPILNDSNLIKKVGGSENTEKVLSFEEESRTIKYCKVGISRGGSCRVKIGITDDDVDDVVSEKSVPVSEGGDEEDEDGQPCSQRK